MTDTPLLKKENNQTVTLTLNRPEVMNAFNFDMLNALKTEIDALRFQKNIRAIIITGAGDRAFCSGADLKERAALSDIEVKTYIFTIRNLFTDIERIGKPVIAAINGIALGGGTELCLAADIRVACDTATMGLTETKLAIIPGAGGTQRLPRLIGPGKAKELIFTGRRINAQEAMAIGLVNQICPRSELLETCEGIASQICDAGPIAIEQAKHAINYGLETDLSTGLAIESNAYWVTIPTKDRLEGLSAFKEKRKPVYEGR
jgi:enoyl-CoA hydratase/carnithine racemase